MANDKKIMATEQITKKTFNYELDGVAINFTMRTDVKRELVAGVKILEKAISDFQEEIKKLDK